MKNVDIKNRFLKYYESNGHKISAEAPLVANYDDSIMFTIAGMCQFKHCFTGDKQPEHQLVTTAQTCIRTNDLDIIGTSNTHLSSFTMLGNFSFGALSKEEACDLALDFLVEEMELDIGRLTISCHKDDQETYQIWESLGVTPCSLFLMGDDDNFWSMGETGPRGYCTEIHYDGMEIWNLVFMDRDEKGNKLPFLGIDTGMGLERLAMIMQHKESVFETDCFEELHESLKVMDHIRTANRLIAEGVVSSSKGEGYVLRKLIREAYNIDPEVVIDKGEIKSYKATIKKLAKVLKKNPNLTAFSLRTTYGIPLDLIKEKTDFNEEEYDQMMKQHKEDSK